MLLNLKALFMYMCDWVKHYYYIIRLFAFGVALEGYKENKGILSSLCYLSSGTVAG